ncbi:histidine phosphatase family protein [Caulobacter sp. S45]|uniref:histidine phosphatase family protein n=1 Tax=Caulobacter sp. S45 TaxID=1641861 RepID=UPI0015755455|nr:histidine phosphatase family protein [Caulobacter sp. S45]
MTTTFHLVRHGSHDRLDRTLCGRMDGVRLGTAGQKEAQGAAERLAGDDLAAVVSSPLERCRQTADAVAEGHGLPVETDAAFVELDFGEWTGLSFTELEADPRWEPWNSRRSLNRPPGGESLGEAQMRSVRGLEQLRARHPGQAVAVVTHSDIIKALAAHVLGLNLDLYHRFDVDPASITTLALGDWGAKLIRLNLR